MVYILIVVLFSCIVGLLIANLPNRAFAYASSLMAAAIAGIFTLGVTSTADWKLYYYFFKMEYDKTDFAFYYLSLLFNKYQLKYDHLFLFHIILILAMYFFIISRFSKNIIFVFILYLLLDYVHLVNQIRYYLGFPILMSGFYFLIVKKKYVLSSVLITLSILCHSALSVLLVFIPFYFLVPSKSYLKMCIYLSLSAFFVVFIIFNTGLGTTINHFGFYLESENGSSFIGGLFNAIPYVSILIYLLIFTLRTKNIMQKFDDPKFLFLYKICFFSMALVPASFLIQIIGHRYVMTFAIFWLLYFLYLTKNLPQKKKLITFLSFTGVLFFVSYSIYILPDFVLKENHFAQELKRSIYSISYLKGIIYD